MDRGRLAWPGRDWIGLENAEWLWSRAQGRLTLTRAQPAQQLQLRLTEQSASASHVCCYLIWCQHLNLRCWSPLTEMLSASLRHHSHFIPTKSFVERIAYHSTTTIAPKAEGDGNVRSGKIHGRLSPGTRSMKLGTGGAIESKIRFEGSWSLPEWPHTLSRFGSQYSSLFREARCNAEGFDFTSHSAAWNSGS